MREGKLTSVKIDPELLEEFKVVSIRTKINFQKLVERSTFLYITNESFRNLIKDTFNTQLTGSL